MFFMFFSNFLCFCISLYLFALAVPMSFFHKLQLFMELFLLIFMGFSMALSTGIWKWILWPFPLTKDNVRYSI